VYIYNGWKLWYAWQFLLRHLQWIKLKAELEGIDNVMLFEKEGEMIDTFLTLIEDS
jgi:hypothetical protein